VGNKTTWIVFERTLAKSTLYIQVLRYSALVFGVFYGITHQASISATHASNDLNKEYEHKQDLINKAKAAFVKKNMPASSKQPGGGST